jgi:hypothetical protein
MSDMQRAFELARREIDACTSSGPFNYPRYVAAIAAYDKVVHCPACSRHMVGIPYNSHKSQNPCSKCRCSLCWDFTAINLMRVPNSCGACFHVVEILDDLKRQWFVLRCVCKSSRACVRYLEASQPLRIYNDDGTTVRDFEEECVEDLDRFITYLWMSFNEQRR